MKTVVLLLLLGVVAEAISAADTFYKVSKLSMTQVGVSCLRGDYPQVGRYGDIVVISCER